MKPESADFLNAAMVALTEGEKNLAIHIPRRAARLSYYAQFHAAQALIFERTGKIARTHKGVQDRFRKLAGEEGFDASLARDFSASYNFKQKADYETGARAQVSELDAKEILMLARAFILAVQGALSPA